MEDERELEALEDPWLKEAIHADLKTLKTLNLGILNSDFYYRKCFDIYADWALKVFLVIIGGAFISIIANRHQVPGFKDTIWGILEMPLIFMLVFSIFSIKLISNYVIFKYQLKDKLKTGDYIIDRFDKILDINFKIFTAFIALFSIGTHFSYIAYNAAFYMVICVIANAFLIEMEIKRVGLTAIFEIIKQLFAKKLAR